MDDFSREMFTGLFDTIGGNDSTSSDLPAQTQMWGEYLRSIKKSCVIKLAWVGAKNTSVDYIFVSDSSRENFFFLFRNHSSSQRVGQLKQIFDQTDSLYRSTWVSSGFITQNPKS